MTNEILRKYQQRLRASLAERDSEVLEFSTDLSRFLRTHTRRILRRIEKEEMQAVEAASALGSLNQALRQSGLGNLLSAQSQIFFNEIDRSLENFLVRPKNRSSTLPETDLYVLEQLIRFNAEASSAVIESNINSIKPLLMQQIIGNIPIDVDEITEELGASTAVQFKNELFTSLSAFNRTVTAQRAADSGIELFLYFGPDDNKTRAFCQDCVDKVFTMKDLQASDNGQGLPVPTYLGGYNCRHHLAPISEEDAKGFKRGSPVHA